MQTLKELKIVLNIGKKQSEMISKTKENSIAPVRIVFNNILGSVFF